MRSIARKLRQRLDLLLHGPEGRRHAAVGPAALWRMKRKFQSDLLDRQGLQPHHRLVDLGCGTLRGGIPLIQRLEPGHYTGIDVRPEVIEQAHAELRDQNLTDKQPNLICSSDLASLELPHKADYIWAFSVLIHMSDDILDTALGFAKRHLAEGGRFLGNVNLDNAKTGNWQGFPVVHHPREWYDARATAHGLKIEDLGSLDDLGHHDGRPDEARRMLLFQHA